MATNPPADLELAPLRGEPHAVSEWVGMFHLLTVAVDPFNERSAWLVETAGRILTQYEQADCRIAWLVGGTPDEAQLFNVVSVFLTRPFEPAGAERRFYATSSCGICGKASLDQVEVHCAAIPALFGSSTHRCQYVRA